MVEDKNQENNKDNFIYPKAPYHGQVKPENLVFNANLQEFAHKVMYICNLETSGKISTVEAYQKIKQLWKFLHQSKKNLGIGDEPFNNENL